MSSGLMLDPLDTAYLVGLGRDGIYVGMKNGQIPAIRVGRAWRVPAHRLATEVLGCTVADIVAALEERDRAVASVKQGADASLGREAD